MTDANRKPLQPLYGDLYKVIEASKPKMVSLGRLKSFLQELDGTDRRIRFDARWPRPLGAATNATYFQKENGS